MERYSGKSKCSCGRRAKYRAVDGANRWFACEDHKFRLEGKHKPIKPEHFTEADYQTWMRL